jgi:hypothetical protein
MSDKVTKYRRSATATSQKAQKKGGEDKTSSFAEDVSAELARDMEKWEKESEEREAQEEDEEFFPTIPMEVPSTSRPPATVTNTTPNEVIPKRQRTANNCRKLLAPIFGSAVLCLFGITSFGVVFVTVAGGRLVDGTPIGMVGKNSSSSS